MFYTNSTFVAYIKDFDFRSLVRWVDCITSTASSPKITVHVKLLDRIKCAYELLDPVRLWRDINHQNIHLRIHNCYTGGLGQVHRITGFDQRQLVATAVRIAEQLRQQGDTTEAKLLSKCHEHFEEIDRWKLDSLSQVHTRSCMFGGVGYHPL
jgi:hypothetical protein